MEIIIKKGEGYLRRQSECSKKERRMDCDGGAAEDGGDGKQTTKDARLQWKGSESGSGFWLLNWNN